MNDDRIRHEIVFVIDRIEESVAVLIADAGDEETVPVRVLPAGLREGTVLRVRRDATGGPDWTTARPDPEETQRRLARARRILDELAKRDPGSDLAL